MGPGTVLAGRYRLEDLLVDRAGGRFWRATDTVLARNVAVHAVSSEDPRAGDLLEAARLSATVNDSHLLRVLDCDDDGDVCWVVNEWGEGLSLDLLLDRGPLAPARAGWLAHEVAQAIAAGHEQGVPHGRLVPETVLVTHSGSVKLIGYVVDAALHGAPPDHPALGHLTTEEVDVLGIGGVLYAGLTGRWPGPVPSRLPDAPVEAGYALRPRQVRAGVPRALDAICERVLHREGSRHEIALTTAREVAAALAEATGSSPTGVRPAVVPHAAAPGAWNAQADPWEDGAGTSTSQDDTVHVPSLPDEPAAGTGPESGQSDQADQAGAPAETGDEATTVFAAAPTTDTGDLEATQAAPALGSARAPALEHTVLHHEPLEGPDDLHPLRAPADEPPPPPFEDSPERPLFATTERRVPASGRATETGTGSFAATGAGPAASAAPGPAGPDYWPFESEDPRVAAAPGHAGRGWLRTAVIVALILLTAVAMTVAFSLGRLSGVPGIGDGGTEDEPQAAPEDQPSQVLSIESVSDFDPEGDQTENPDQTGNAVDGDPATTWSTVTYFNRPDLGGLKSGVGLMLDLGSDQELREVAVAFASVPTDLEVYAAPAGVTSAPTGVDQMELVGERNEVGERADIELEEPVSTRFVVVWLTRLPPTEGGFRGEIADLELRS